MKLSQLYRMVYPDICCICQAYPPEGDTRVCRRCRQGLPYIYEPICRSCGGPLASDFSLCHECDNNPRIWEHAATAFRFDGLARQCVHRLKYNGDIALTPFLAQSAWQAWHKLYPDVALDYICPVPLHWWRKFRRGYNQAEMLCLELARQSDIPHLPLLQRHRPTQPQANLSRARRLRNLSKAFRVRPKYDLKGKEILLVDDVMTTGSTLAECCKSLLKGGAAKVHILTIARRV